MPVDAPSHVATVPMSHPGHIFGPPGHQMPHGTPAGKGQVDGFGNPLFNAINNRVRKAREKKTESLPVASPPPPPPTPPYEKRLKPTERKVVNKSGRRNMRRQAEAEIFPWNRKLDFKATRANATWDDSIYEKATLAGMAATRAKNEAVIERIDGEENEKQRTYRKN